MASIFPSLNLAPSPPEASPFYTHWSALLPEVATGVLKHSNNLSAELIGQVTSRKLTGRALSVRESATVVAAGIVILCRTPRGMGLSAPIIPVSVPRLVSLLDNSRRSSVMGGRYRQAFRRFQIYSPRRCGSESTDLHFLPSEPNPER